MSQDNPDSKKQDRDQITGVAIILLALAFAVIQIAETIDAFQNDEFTQIVIHGLGIVGGISGVIWGAFKIRDRTEVI